MKRRTSASVVQRNGVGLVEDTEQIGFSQTIRERRPEARGQPGMVDPHDMCHL
jgi:hypothetical protein